MNNREIACSMNNHMDNISSGTFSWRGCRELLKFSDQELPGKMIIYTYICHERRVELIMLAD